MSEDMKQPKLVDKLRAALAFDEVNWEHAERYGPYHETLFECVEALEILRCQEVRNYEGSGMFNKHDPECVKCKALTKLKELL